MFSRVYNRILIDYRIEAASPLLVKSGGRNADPSLPDMEFVRTRTSLGVQLFIPGSSMKGVLRSHAERLLRAAFSTAAACDPTDRRDNCGAQVRQRRDASSADRYKMVCPACRLFGSTSVASRAQFTDLMPPQDVQTITEIRTSVGIDRLLGSAVRGALFDYEVASVGSQFRGELLLENFEMWQFGLLAAAIGDLSAGFVRLGFGSSRGLGRVVVHIDSLLIEQKCGTGTSGAIRGVGELVDDAERAQYGLQSKDHLAANLPTASMSRTWLMERCAMSSGDDIASVMNLARNVEPPRDIARRRTGDGRR
jgi:CRISPR-associated RAMP protein (TIGR02581 family)